MAAVDRHGNRRYNNRHRSECWNEQNKLNLSASSISHVLDIFVWKENMASTLQTQHDTQGGVYTFSSRPRPVPNRAKYRNTAEPLWVNLTSPARMI